MRMDKLAGSGNDEFYTPKYAVEPILEFIKPNSKILCPFDTVESWFVKVLEREGHTVVATHIVNGEDFFDIIESDLADWADYIISNPPYSMKAEVLEALFESEKKFAMLLGVVGLFESQRRFKMFKNNNFEVMYLNLRVDYFSDMEEQKPSKNPPFSSVYITSGMLPEQIMFRYIDKKDLGEQEATNDDD